MRSGGESCLLWSRRQAELFIARQTARLQNNEESALPPAQLQQVIRQVLQANPDHFEAVSSLFFTISQFDKSSWFLVVKGQLCFLIHPIPDRRIRIEKQSEKSTPIGKEAAWLDRSCCAFH